MQVAQKILRVQPQDCAVVDIGSCTGRFVFFSSLLGWESIGVEIHRQRWAISVILLSRLRQTQVLDNTPAIALLQADATNIERYEPLSPGKKVIIYCWDRGLEPYQFEAIALAAACSPAVVGFLSTRAVNHQAFKERATIASCKAEAVSFSLTLYERLAGDRLAEEVPSPRMELSTTVATVDGFLKEFYPVAEQVIASRPSSGQQRPANAALSTVDDFVDATDWFDNEDDADVEKELSNDTEVSKMDVDTFEDATDWMNGKKDDVEVEEELSNDAACAEMDVDTFEDATDWMKGKQYDARVECGFEVRRQLEEAKDNARATARSQVELNRRRCAAAIDQVKSKFENPPRFEGLDWIRVGGQEPRQTGEEDWGVGQWEEGMGEPPPPPPPPPALIHFSQELNGAHVGGMDYLIELASNAATEIVRRVKADQVWREWIVEEVVAPLREARAEMEVTDAAAGAEIEMLKKSGGKGSGSGGDGGDGDGNDDGDGGDGGDGGGGGGDDGGDGGDGDDSGNDNKGGGGGCSGSSDSGGDVSGGDDSGDDEAGDEADDEADGEAGDFAYTTEKRIRSKTRDVVRSPSHPPGPSYSDLDTKKEKKQARYQWAVGFARFEGIGSRDCGCELHSKGCYGYIMDRVPVQDLAKLCVEQYADKAGTYEARMVMLNTAAVEVAPHLFDLHYRLHNNYEVCRNAYLYFTALCSSTLRTLESNFCLGKLNYGHKKRKSRQTKLHDTMKESAADWIERRVHLLAEEQPNSHGLVHGEGSDSDDGSYVTIRNDKGEWQVVADDASITKKRQRKTSLQKWKAKRHMDPVVKKEWHVHYCNDMAALSIAVVAVAVFNTLCREVFKRLSVYIRKNKGCSNDCKGVWSKKHAHDARNPRGRVRTHHTRARAVG